ncbi:MAG: hypothetical protein CM15mP47_4850 [Methanobacteriota archaeon]|nr:MAG: hypothetical protein CM15mP47_4850 [Euryarchaeota archaeon]
MVNRDAAQQIAEGRISTAESTGSAIRSGHQSPPISGCSNLFLTTAGNSNFDSMIEMMGEGYIVNSVMGAHTLTQQAAIFQLLQLYTKS